MLWSILSVRPKIWLRISSRTQWLELDATLKAHNQELEKLKSLKEVKVSERDKSKGGIARAIEDLDTLQEAAALLKKEHEAFATESGDGK